ncbi:hypothetical protein ACFX10_011063 [Malus domestica]
MVINKGFSVRFAFAAAIFGESSEALFWLQLPRTPNHLLNKMVNKSPQKSPASASVPEIDDASILNRITSKGKSVSGTENKDAMGDPSGCGDPDDEFGCVNGKTILEIFPGKY